MNAYEVLKAVGFGNMPPGFSGTFTSVEGRKLWRSWQDRRKYRKIRHKRFKSRRKMSKKKASNSCRKERQSIIEMKQKWFVMY